ncbi:MAG: twin-arginine translocase TatA/TatE family subunit [Planctomycetes bacterium]|nr:twin-arginine translocase TatA/TatE family subunit [Planctomycetota bacterium]
MLGFFTGMPGPVELLIIGAIILLLFGNRLPGAMRSLGRSVVEFKKGVRDDSQDDDQQQSAKVEDKSKQEKEAAK